MLVLLTQPPSPSVGAIYASLAYLFAFIAALDHVLTTIERTVQAYDITRRLAASSAV